MNPRTPHYYSQSRKGGNSTSIDSLPDDLLLFEILVRVPAEDIHENARIVCRRWKSIIRGDGFVNAHFCRNTCSGLVIVSKCMMEGDFANSHFRLDRSGVLIAKFSEENYHHLVAEAQSRIQISRLRYKFNFPVLAGCNGLILGKETENYRSYYVNRVTEPFIVNPATRRRFNLPHFAGGGLDGCKFALAYAVSTAEYKVVVTWCDFRLGSPAVAWCAILTVGVDKTWRRVPMEQLPDLAKLLFHRTPIVTEGFIHWAQEEDVLSMNVETEAITHTRTPLPPQDHLYEIRLRYCHYLTAGKYLSLLVSYKDNDLFEIWEMKPDSGEWRKLVDEIDLKSRKCKLRQLWCYYIMPVGWVKYPDALAFFGNGKGGSCIIYNLKNDEFNCFGASDPDSVHQLHNAVVHRNSLVWLS